MTITLYTLGQAAKRLGLNRTLVTFLVNDRDIQTHGIGSARALDEAGLERLRLAAADYRSKTTATAS